MRVLIMTSGSMGDVAPYTGLGQRLVAAGHEVTIAAHEPFRDEIELPFLPLPGDLRQVLPQAGNGNPLRLLRLARPLVADLGAGLTEAVRRSRAQVLLVSTLVAPLAYQVAEAAGIPCAGVFLQPVHPTRDFGPVLLGGRGVRRVNRMLGQLSEIPSQWLYRGPVRDLRDRLGLPRAGNRDLERAQRHRFPTFHGFSELVVPRPADWPASHEVVGYWWPARPTGWEPPREVSAFLAAGPPPVFIGFGSMAPGQGERLAGPVLRAVRQAGVRAIVQAGWSGLRAGEDPGTLGVGPLPHDWLFPRTAAVVHHAGAGTTGAGLRAGVPAVGVPVLADQPFWARRLHSLGVGPAPVPLARLTTGRLAAAIGAATSDPRYRERAAVLAARIRTENGSARVISWLEEMARADR